MPPAGGDSDGVTAGCACLVVSLFGWRHGRWLLYLFRIFVWACLTSYGYSNQMGYQTSDFRLLWTITPNPPPPPTPTPFLPPPPPCQTSPPPPVSPPISDLSHCHHTLEV